MRESGGVVVLDIQEMGLFATDGDNTIRLACHSTSPPPLRSPREEEHSVRVDDFGSSSALPALGAREYAAGIQTGSLTLYAPAALIDGLNNL